MTEAHTHVPISEGAQELLRIVMENDRHGAIAWNAALVAALEWLERLHEASKRSFSGLETLLQRPRAPKTFLDFTCATLVCVQRELDRRYQGSARSEEPLVTDFNRHVLQALAETLADAAWPERSANEFDGPPVQQVADRLRNKVPPELYRSLIRNYLGNILQDCFAASRIREQVDLHRATESKLRSEDADKIAGFVIQTVQSKSAAPSVKLVIEQLKAVLDDIKR